MTPDEIRSLAESDLYSFIKLVAPHRVLGHVHEDLIHWWTRGDKSTHQLALIPRAHQKSIMMAYRVAHRITVDPSVTILYISSTANLAEKQLKAIQDILTSPIYKRYWPDMINDQEGKREKWTTGEISVDHPRRKEEGIRDPTVFTAGLTTSITGLHCDVSVMDDVVVNETAYTEEGRRKVRTQYSLLSSIENPDSEEWIVGTRYHPKDLYNDLKEMKEDIYDNEGQVIEQKEVYEIFERQVETIGDGTGEFLWPKQQRGDGKWFGFDMQVLSKKRAQYLDKAQFYAQYYNNPNDPTGSRINHDVFQYYNPKFLEQRNGDWYFKDNKLNVYASIDFAFSLKKQADYSAIVAIGIDSENNIYVLGIDRFKTDRISVYFEHILQMFLKWEFKKMRAEVTVAQKTIVKDLKENYIKRNGLALKVEEYRPTGSMGSKLERISAILEPRYDNLNMWHYRGGHCQMLEEELTLSHPPHDDMKDALASAVDMAIPPRGIHSYSGQGLVTNVVQINKRFGGVSY